MKKHALLVENNNQVIRTARDVLSAMGWQVTVEALGDEALKRLDASEDNPFALIACGFYPQTSQGPESGISILASARTVSPETQRMLWLPSDDPESLVLAINSAHINACITYPLQAENLTRQVENCGRRFEAAMKRRQFKSMIISHNRKMFRMARNLKKKDENSRLLIDEKKAKILGLKTLQREMEKTEELSVHINLGELIAHKNLPREPDAFVALFNHIYGHVADMFSTLTGRHGTDWKPPPAKDLFDTDTAEDEPPELVEKILRAGYMAVLETPIEAKSDGQTERAAAGGDEPDMLTDFLRLTIPPDGSQALLEKTGTIRPDQVLDVDTILDLLVEKDICFGIAKPGDIERWIADAAPGDDPFVAARSNSPTPCFHGRVKYYFEIDYTNPGRVREDGSIDFQDRGDVPYVAEGTLLVRKTPPKTGKPGIDIFGNEIPVKEPLDPAFLTGNGTRLSKDGLEIYAQTGGQPHLDAMGTVTVNQELDIKGDVGFETGNINFNGNVMIRGIVKPGFKVKAVSLTANEIEGGIIELTGDLNVSSGIIDARIITVGNIHTRFIHNSRVAGFGDFHVQREIMDSRVVLSGGCIVPGGHIIASEIAAKKGIDAGSVGNISSRPSQLRVGVDDHVRSLLIKNKAALDKSLEKIRSLESDIRLLKIRDSQLDLTATGKTHAQEACHQEIKVLKQRYSAQKEAAQEKELQQIVAEIKAVLEKAKTAEKGLEEIFRQQDELREEIDRKKALVNELGETNIALVEERKSLTQYGGKCESDPSVTVRHTIIQKTVVQGVASAMVLKTDEKRCKIEEVKIRESVGPPQYEMQIKPLSN